MVLQRAFAETGRSMYWQINCQRKIIFRSCSTYLLFSGLKLPRVGSVLFFVIMQMSSFILPVIKASTTSLDILFYLYHQSLIFRQSNFLSRIKASPNSMISFVIYFQYHYLMSFTSIGAFRQQARIPDGQRDRDVRRGYRCGR